MTLGEGSYIISVKEQSDLRSKVFQGAKGVEKHSVLRSKVLFAAKCSEKLSVPGNKRC